MGSFLSMSSSQPDLFSRSWDKFFLIKLWFHIDNLMLVVKNLVVTFDVERKTKGAWCEVDFRVTARFAGERCSFGKKGLWMISAVDKPFTRDLISSGGKEPRRTPPLEAPAWRDIGRSSLPSGCLGGTSLHLARRGQKRMQGLLRRWHSCPLGQLCPLQGFSGSVEGVASPESCLVTFSRSQPLSPDDIKAGRKRCASSISDSELVSFPNLA